MYGILEIRENLPEEIKKNIAGFLRTVEDIEQVIRVLTKQGKLIEYKNINQYRDSWGSHFEIAFPGVKKEDLSVNMNEKNQLIVSRNTEKDGDEPVRGYIVKSIEKTSEITIDVDKDLFDNEGIKVKYENGMLYIAIPFKKKEEQKTVEIKIE